MEIIQKALEQKLYVTKKENLKNQTWKDFEKAVTSKKVWIFGAGNTAEFFWERYKGSIPIEGVIDNDRRKQGNYLEDYVGITQDSPEGKFIIRGITALSAVDMEQVVILVSSVRYYEEIADQLESIGIKDVFIMLIMEANEHKEETLSEVKDKESTSKEEAYALECMKEPIEAKKILVAIGIHGGHGKQISKRMVEKKPDLDIVWIVENKPTEIPEGIRYILAGNWKEYIRELETAHIWIYDDMIPLYAHKRNGQIYIQAKHWAGITLKKFYWDIKQYLNVPIARKRYSHNNRAIDYILVGSEFDEKSCRSGFDFDGECIYVGSPRTDVLFENGLREKVCSYYGISLDKHILLYAPTFRATNSEASMGRMKSVDMDFEKIEKVLQKKFGGEWVIFLRLHPYIAIESSKLKRPDFVIDASYYPDSQELVAAMDIMITDYSSIMFEPAFIEKPVLLYAPDKDDYIKNDRGLLIDYDSLPFPISESNEELAETIMKFEKGDYDKRVNDFLDNYGVHEDGYASERATEFILGLLE